MPADSVAHLLTFLALIRLAHSPGGQQLLAPRLPAAAAMLLRGLDMDRPALRRTCLPVRRVFWVSVSVLEFAYIIPILVLKGREMNRPALRRSCLPVRRISAPV